MFRKTQNGSQLNIFSSVSSMLQGSSYEQYSNDNAWHNMFRQQVLMRIDESIYKTLFAETMGAPNASVRILLSMMVLKEAFGWSDSQLFERCRFDLLVRSALGLFNINEPLPGESTYYLLRKRIHDYQRTSGKNLIEETFATITRGQVLDFDVSGRSIRMDSKLIGSNISWYSRYELIHQTIGLFYQSLGAAAKSKINTFDTATLTDIIAEQGNKVVYRSNREEINTRLQTLGALMYQLVNLFSEADSIHYPTLKRVFNEQFRMSETDQVSLRPKEEITSDSVQSPHDTDCSYRDKDGKKVKGYHYNLTETCDDGSLNLVTNVQVANASTPENGFLQPSVEETSRVLTHTPDNLHTDGAYNSQSNAAYCKDEQINFFLTGIQGAEGRYNLELTPQGLLVTDTQTGESLMASQTKTGTWRIKTDNNYRYFKEEQIEACRMRKQIAQLPSSIKNRRNNVEATIFHFCFFTRNNKTRYRGIIKQTIWAHLRCLWINLVRIINHVGQICQRTCKMGEIIAQNAIFLLKIDSNTNFYESFSILTQILYLFRMFLNNQPLRKINFS
jgi:hypothetical protein